GPTSPLRERARGLVRGRKTTRLYPAGWRCAVEANTRTALRMGEAEPAGVEAETCSAARAASLRLVADDRMTHRRQLHPDLVSSPGAEREVEDRAVASALPHAVFGDRELPGRARAHAEVLVLRQTALERAFLLVHASFDDGHVDALDGASLELRLQAALGAL